MMALIGIIVAKVAVATQNPLLAVGVGPGARLPARAAQRHSGAQAQHFAADRDAGDAGALRRSRLRRQQHRGLRLSRQRSSNSAAARSSASSTPCIIAVAIFVVGSFVLTRTVTGLRIYAIGGDPRAAELCGVPVGRTVVGLYAVNGLLIGLVAVLVAGRLGSITPTIGVRFELDVLTAAILGGVAFSGGAGRPLGIAIGVATIGILNAGLIFVGLQSWWQSIAVGGMLLLALVADQVAVGMRSRRAQARRRRLRGRRRSTLAAPPGRLQRDGGRRRRRQRRADAAPAFSIAGRAQILWRADRAGGGRLQRRQRRGGLPARRQRRRQEHAGQDHLRRHPARCRRDDARRAAGRSSEARRTRAPPASRRSIRTSRCARTSASPTT